MARFLISIIGKPTFLNSFLSSRLIFCCRDINVQISRNKMNHFGFGCLNSNKVVLSHSKSFSTNAEKQPDKSLQQHTQTDISEEVKPITFKKVKETTQTASYLGVILLGVGVTGIMFYTVFSELFSSKSPNNVYAKALERVINDTRIQDALGEPLKGYGEETRRGRRQHVSHLLYEKNGEKRLRMKFYISGSRKRATVHLEMKEGDSGNYAYRYLFVELDDFGRHPIVLEDNRTAASSTAKKGSEDFDLSSAPINMNLNFPDAELK